MKKLLLISAISLIIPATSMGAEPSGTLCDTRNGLCYEINPVEDIKKVTESITYNPGSDTNGWYMTGTGTYAMRRSSDCWYSYNTMDLWRSMGSPVSIRNCVYVGWKAVSYKYNKYTFNGLSAEDADRFSFSKQLIVNQQYVGETMVSQVIAVEHRTPVSQSAYCTYFAHLGDLSIAADRTPDSVFTACGYKYRLKDAPQTNTTTTTTTTTTTQPVAPVKPAVVIPSTSTKCGSIADDETMVGIRSISLSCGTARIVITRMIMRGTPPSGWGCLTVVQSGFERTKCTRSGKAKQRATVFAIKKTAP